MHMCVYMLPCPRSRHRATSRRLGSRLVQEGGPGVGVESSLVGEAGSGVGSGVPAELVHTCRGTRNALIIKCKKLHIPALSPSLLGWYRRQSSLFERLWNLQTDHTYWLNLANTPGILCLNTRVRYSPHVASFTGFFHLPTKAHIIEVALSGTGTICITRCVCSCVCCVHHLCIRWYWQVLRSQARPVDHLPWPGPQRHTTKVSCWLQPS